MLLLGAAALFELIQYGTVWGPPFGLPLYALDVLGFGFGGLTFVLAAILAIPGCEMGAIPHLVARASGGEVAEHY